MCFTPFQQYFGHITEGMLKVTDIQRHDNLNQNLLLTTLHTFVQTNKYGGIYGENVLFI